MLPLNVLKLQVECGLLSMIQRPRALFRKHPTPALRLPAGSLHSSLLSTVCTPTYELANRRGGKLRAHSTLVKMVTDAGRGYAERGSGARMESRTSVDAPLRPAHLRRPCQNRPLCAHGGCLGRSSHQCPLTNAHVGLPCVSAVLVPVRPLLHSFEKQRQGSHNES